MTTVILGMPLAASTGCLALARWALETSDPVKHGDWDCIPRPERIVLTKLTDLLLGLCWIGLIDWLLTEGLTIGFSLWNG
jgi:hypothetical protein